MKISIIIPVYNVENYLKKCLDSITEQTYKDIEIILIDDGSKDNSGIICDQYASIDKRVIVIHKNNNGVSAARNDGIKLASGEYVCFVDSDDWIDTDYIELAVCELKQHKPSLLVNNYKKINNYGKIYTRRFIEKRITLKKEEAITQLAKQDYFDWCPFACFYKTDECKNIGFDKNIHFGEDLLFKYRFITNSSYPIVYIPMAKYYYFDRASSACNSYGLIKRLDALIVFETIISEVQNNGLAKKYFSDMYRNSLVEDLVIAKFDDVDTNVEQQLRSKLRSYISISSIIPILGIYLRKLVPHYLPPIIVNKLKELRYR